MEQKLCEFWPNKNLRKNFTSASDQTLPGYTFSATGATKIVEIQ